MKVQIIMHIIMQIIDAEPGSVYKFKMSDSTSDSDDTTTKTYLSDSNDLDGSSNPKKAKVTRKNHGAAVYRTKFNPQWREKFPFIDKVSDDIYSFYCNICKRSVKCSHMGITDVERHVNLIAS